MRLARTLALLSLAATFLIPCPDARAKPGQAVARTAPDQARKTWKGDLEGMVQRRLVRVLVVYNKTHYFLDGPRTRGITYEALKNFEKDLNQRYKKKHLKIHLVMLPVARDQLIPFLRQGRGDLAAANLTITPQRKELVEFGAPFSTQVDELVVTGPAVPPLKSLGDLAGRTVYVRRSSSYYESLQKLNQRLTSEGKEPVKIEEADERLETEDILEMVNAGVIDITVADSHLTDFWRQIFTDLKVYPDLALRKGAAIAWAMRKHSPQLKEAVDAFVRKNQQGTLMGNILIKRYLQSTKWARRVLAPDALERFRSTIDLFKRFAGQYGFDWLVVAAQAYQESGIDQSKRSPAGAIGVMQLLPATAAGPPVSIPEIEKIDNNIHAGVKYLHYIHDTHFRDSGLNRLDKMLMSFAAYNAGPARVAGLRKKAAAMGLDPDVWFRNVEVAAAREIGRETVQYVSNIFKYYLAYKMILDKEAKRAKAKEALQGR